jgi:putative proteasome-type protease
MSFEDAVKLLMVSFDSTLKANLSVGMPLDMLVMEQDLFEPLHSQRVTDTNPYFRQISSGWGEALKRAFYQLPEFNFDDVEPTPENALRMVEPTK